MSQEDEQENNEDPKYDLSYLSVQDKIDLDEYLEEIEQYPHSFTWDKIFDHLLQIGVRLSESDAMELVLERTGQDYRGVKKSGDKSYVEPYSKSEDRSSEYVFKGRNLKEVSESCKKLYPDHMVFVESKFYSSDVYVAIGDDALRLEELFGVSTSQKPYKKASFGREKFSKLLEDLRSRNISYCILNKKSDTNEYELINRNDHGQGFGMDSGDEGQYKNCDLSHEEKIAKVRETYPNAWTPWSAEDDEDLKNLFAEGLNEREISDRLGRNPNAIRKRIRKKSLEVHDLNRDLNSVRSPSIPIKSRDQVYGRSTIYCRKRALELLRIGSGIPDAEFREGQEEAIQRVVNGGGRLLVVQKTGWGKSFVYFIAIKLLREAGMGPALIISPLLALMRNQLVAAKRMGVEAETINSDNTNDWRRITDRVSAGTVDVLLISPERLANDKFQSQVMPHISNHASLLVIDEAHCISDWGHDFRPHYRLIERLSRNLPANLRLLATTATANQRVMDDLCEILGPDLEVSRGSLVRHSLQLQTFRYDSKAERMAWICQVMDQMSGNGIIYTLKKRDAKFLAHWLLSKGHEVKSYTGDSKTEDRPILEEALLNNKVKALVATQALGMGFDKPDLSFVFHFQAPGSVVSYYQQVGRAGRAIEHAHGVLLAGSEDLDITNFFIEEAFPSEKEILQVIDALDLAEIGLSIRDLQKLINLGTKRIKQILMLLGLESPAPVVKVSSTWRRTAVPLNKEFLKRANRLTALRKKEQAQMQEYVDLKEGHMAFLVESLDGVAEAMPPSGCESLEIELCEDLVREADKFLNTLYLPIEPREEWPNEGMPRMGVNGAIPAEMRNQVGRALCFYGFRKLGKLVEQGKYKDERFDEGLVIACADLVKKWKPEVKWVCGIPSLRKPGLVSGFCEQLASKLQIPYLPVLVGVEQRREQKEMQNPTQKARNVDGAMAVDSSLVFPKGPVLLVDDMVASRWTLTVAGWLLKQAGVEDVYPMALAQAGDGS